MDDEFLAACVDLQRQMRLCLTSKKDSKEMIHSVVKTMFTSFTQDLADEVIDGMGEYLDHPRCVSLASRFGLLGRSKYSHWSAG